MPKDGFKTKQNKKHNSTSKINVASWLQLLPQLHSGRRLSIQAQSDLQVPAVQADAVPQAVVHSFTCRGRFSSVTEGGCVILGDMPYFCAHLFFFLIVSVLTFKNSPPQELLLLRATKLPNRLSLSL